MAVTIFMLLNSTAFLILEIEFNIGQIPLLGFSSPNEAVETMQHLSNIRVAANFLGRLNVGIQIYY